MLRLFSGLLGSADQPTAAGSTDHELNLESTQSSSSDVTAAMLHSVIRSLSLQLDQQIRESEDRMRMRMEAMESKLHQSLTQSSSKLEKMMDEQVFYCSQSLINVMSLVESKVNQNSEQIAKAKDSLVKKLDGMSSLWSSADQVMTGRLEAHEVAVQSQVRQLATDSDLKYRTILHSLTDVTLNIKSLNHSVIQLSKSESNSRSSSRSTWSPSADRSRSVTLSDVMVTGTSVDEQLKKIDVDVETYTKKVVNNMSDLWRISKSVEGITNTSIGIVNQTFASMTRQLSALNHTLSHDVPSILSIVHRSLETRFNELADKVLESHNVILVNQNHFRDSCQRIQGEEGQVYDVFDARLEIMNSTMFSMIDMESRMSERMDKKLHDIFSLMEKTVRFVKHRFREFPDINTSNRFNATSAVYSPIAGRPVAQPDALPGHTNFSTKQAAAKTGE